ncbi:Glutathione S-transferase, C-terminal-like [Parasponia andersonii]|uniref:Glutathione S-transferase, C-terminal-like n=1 Tax=Parasponia andersonii TaxID=3476 RepID=A0A2P5APM0_PARAD|nr:Glutathione S-transferase, C-terminal-like [Parasponia andersonii]
MLGSPVSHYWVIGGFRIQLILSFMTFNVDCKHCFLKHTTSSECIVIGKVKYLGEKFGPEEILPWIKHHIGNGFVALENLLKDNVGRYATGDEVFLADLFLAPQIYSYTTRFNLDLNQFPLLSRLNEAYSQVSEFQNAIPEKQPDNPSSGTS